MIQNRRSFEDTATVFLNKPFLLIAACPCLRLTPNKNHKSIISISGFRESYILGISCYPPLLVSTCLRLALLYIWIPHPGNHMRSASGNGALVPRLSRLKLSEHHSVRPRTFFDPRMGIWQPKEKPFNSNLCIFQMPTRSQAWYVVLGMQ